MNKILNKDKNLTRILAVFLVCFVLFSITQGKSFLSVSSFQSMGKLFPEFGLLAIGMALALITGGIDLSVVYIANLCSITAALTIKAMTPEGDAGIGAILAGVLVAIIFVICAAVMIFIVDKTTLGQKIKMMGTNMKASAFSGFNNVKLSVINYMMIGILSAVAGIIMLGRYSSAKADNGVSYTMQAIMIAVMGGIDPAGGKGNIQGVCVAVLIIQMVSTWLSMYQNISDFYKQIIWGALLLIVLLLNYYINKREVAKAAKK